ncbi:ribonuclease H family protein [Shewanella surugensis]|uniref:ribonuclease H n=1 Tax=Shewanella surugensis TaxID=212020 RepID=A0ABT0LER7_9GAMM|nr:ribonuclease H family protein [Shewanella surugensis]MCL1125830.1 ribonuclease H family protein [Shewanella surugensis]
MAKKFYVVWAGRKTGIFTQWDETKKQVDHFAGAKYKSFKTEAEAKAAFAQGSNQSSSNKKTTTTPKAKATPASLQDNHQQIDVILYTDGGCEPNPGKAGSGVAMYHKTALTALYYGLYDANGTNNSAELNALYQALLLAKEAIDAKQSVQILSDSQYSINCITQWATGWKAKGWKRQKAGDIKNLEIIKQAYALYESLKADLSIQHVAAHIGIEGNELADRMSIYAIEQKNPQFCRYDKTLDIPYLLSLRTG